MLKKTTLAILGLAASGIVSAGMYSPPPAPSCTPGDVTVPCAMTQWDIGVQALYFQPIYNADQGYAFTTIYDTNPQQRRNRSGWGYRIEGSYHFNTGNDLTMTWLNYNVDSNHSNMAGVLPFPPVLPSISPYRSFRDNKFDQVNLVMGQHVDMGLLKNARFYAGMQYARIRNDISNRFVSVPTPYVLQGVASIFQFVNTDFNGGGPTFGIDYSYDLPRGFSVTANTAASILYGTSRYNAGFSFNPSGLVPLSFYSTKKAIVPSLEAKLGLNYDYEWAQGVLNFQGGYQVLNYFGALETRGLLGTAHSSTTDFGLFGPYFGVRWIANA